ncbi:hypothetical protein DsansV1_C07g0071281 [Dioscorea sansibarensis]
MMIEPHELAWLLIFRVNVALLDVYGILMVDLDDLIWFGSMGM